MVALKYKFDEKDDVMMMQWNVMEIDRGFYITIYQTG